MWTPAAFAEALDDIYECAASPAGWPRALETMAKSFRCTSASVEWLGPGAESHALFEFGADQKYLRRLIEQREDDPEEASAFAAPLRRYRNFEAASLTAALDGGVSWMRPAGFRDAICVDLLSQGQRRARLTLARSSVQAGFAEAEKQGLVELAPHLTRVAEIAGALRLQKLKSAWLQHALDALPTPIALAGDRAEPLYMNKAAQRLAEAGRVLAVERGRLALLPQAGAASRPLDDLASETHGASYVVNQGPDNALVHVVGLSDADEGLGSLVAVTSPQTRARTLTQLFARLHRLSPMETRVLEALAAGGGTASIATQLGLSANTIKTHLKALFAKTGTNRQGELLHRYLSCNDAGVDLSALSSQEISRL